MSHQKGFGPHLMLDLNQCNPECLNSIDHCFKLLNELPDHIGMTKITMPHVFPYEGLVPEDKGITGTVIIAESHLSIHTFPLKEYIYTMFKFYEEEGLYQIQIVDGLNFVASKYFDITENNWKLDKLIPSMNDAFEICKTIEDKNV